MKRILMVLLAATLPLCALTEIRDTLYTISGQKRSALLTLTWPDFNTSDGRRIPEGRREYQVQRGRVKLNIEPTPAGVSYTATFQYEDGMTVIETWQVPDTGVPQTLDDIRSDEPTATWLACVDGELAKMSGGVWTCQPDATGGSPAWGLITGTLASQTDLQTALNAKQATSEKGQINGYASLDGSGDVPDAQIPAAITRDSELGTAAPLDVGTGTGMVAAGDHAHSGVYQPSDADLDAIAALACADGEIAKRSGGVWTCQADATGGSPTWGSITGTLASQTDLQSALDAKQATSEKGQINGYASLDGSGDVPDAQIPAAITRDSELGTSAPLDVGSSTGTVAAGDHAHSGVYQPSDADLDAIAALACADGEVAKKSGGVWTCQADATGGSPTWGSITGTLSSQTDLQTALNAKQATSEKGQADGYASLDGSGDVPDAQIPAAVTRDSELGTAAPLDVGTGTGTVAAGDHAHSGVYQPSDADLTAIAALACADGEVAKKAAGVWTCQADATGGSPTWGSITGTLSSQTDLQTALNAKQATSEKGQADGYASLDGSGDVPDAQIPAAVTRDSELGTSAPLDVGTGTGTVAAGDHAHSGVYQPSDADLTAIAALACADGEVAKKSGGVWTCQADATGGSPTWGSITGTLSSQTDLQTALNAKQATSEKGQANGYASLDGSGDVPDAQIPAAVTRDSELGTSAPLDVGSSTGTVAAGDHAHSGVYQPSDADLTAIAALACADGEVAKRSGGVWTCQADATGSAALPDATGNAHKLLSNDGVDADWRQLGFGLICNLTDCRVDDTIIAFLDGDNDFSGSTTFTGDVTLGAASMFDASGASATNPTKAGATLPTTCDPNKEYFTKTDPATPGQQLYVCNATGDGWNLVGDGGGGASTFLALTDTPSSFTSQSLKSVRVNAGETALEFYTPSAGGGTMDVGVGAIIGDGTNVLSAGVQGYIMVPFACTITAAEVGADQSGTVSISIWKDTYANFPPTVADTIVASAPLALSAAVKYTDSTLTGWTTSIAAGDWLGIAVDASPTPASITQATVTLTCQRSDATAGETTEAGLESQITDVTNFYTDNDLAANVETFLGAADYAAMKSLLGLNNVENTALSTGNAGTATALAANGANCSAGQYPLGVNASGAVESCTADDTGTDDQVASEVPSTPVGSVAATDVQGAIQELDSEKSYTVASGTATLGTLEIASTACATVVTVSATGVATTDAITWTPNADITAVTGYAPSTSGGLAIYPYPTANNVNFKVCNPTASAITPGAVTLNWRVVR